MSLVLVEENPQSSLTGEAMIKRSCNHCSYEGYDYVEKMSKKTGRPVKFCPKCRWDFAS